VLCQENFQSVELLGNTLDVVESIDTNDELHTIKLTTERSNTFLNLGLLEAFNELLGVNADREGTDADKATIPINTVGGSRGTEDTRAAAEEVASVVVGVEADEIAVEQASEESLTHGKNTVDLTARERSVEEKADTDVLLGGGDLLAEHLGEQHQVVIVDPDKVVILHILEDGLGEETVDFLVGSPGGLVKGDLTGVVVEEGPEDRV
jgi:hypothetical protein